MSPGEAKPWSVIPRVVTVLVHTTTCVSCRRLRPSVRPCVSPAVRDCDCSVSAMCALGYAARIGTNATRPANLTQPAIRMQTATPAAGPVLLCSCQV